MCSSDEGKHISIKAGNGLYDMWTYPPPADNCHAIWNCFMCFLIAIPLQKPRPFCIMDLPIVTFFLWVSIIHIPTGLLSSLGGEALFRLQLGGTLRVCCLIEGVILLNKLNTTVSMQQKYHNSHAYHFLNQILDLSLQIIAPVLCEMFKLFPQVKN